ncbi:PleD family two-component system response regulator [Aquicoccus sp. G2-2]|jgi:DNA-binding response OmpR family regulator|uniref:response regulator n=1 Tax=Aquicoccus sp. G2-2 TaxID=3092120 RepID=UPI002ADF46A0|nr:response regulator [Aquicoccus sp. G2-2]MEA1113944.1 response regulator [Aquicoccus sp. G2-2]
MKIIAVDDDEVSLNLLKNCLSEGGYNELTLMSAPDDALKDIKNADTAYDCILLDVEMPGKNGIQLCADIRKIARYRNTPILMITRLKNHVAVKQAFANGATDYITKPYQFFEVLTRIKVAERLVQERQAAIDSYMAVQNIEKSKRMQNKTPLTHLPDPAMAAEQFQVTGDNILSFSVFRNYLEQATRDDDCKINLVAMKVTKADQIFTKTNAADFVSFLRAGADAMRCHFSPEKSFVTHAGNGMFLCATQSLETIDPAASESKIHALLMKYELPSACLSETVPKVVVAEPLLLTTTPKLNFKRAVKAVMARLEQREIDLSHTDLSLLAG